LSLWSCELSFVEEISQTCFGFSKMEEASPLFVALELRTPFFEEVSQNCFLPDREMDGWMDGRTDGWMDGLMDG
jgi:hypothetical protein